MQNKDNKLPSFSSAVKLDDLLDAQDQYSFTVCNLCAAQNEIPALMIGRMAFNLKVILRIKFLAIASWLLCSRQRIFLIKTI